MSSESFNTIREFLQDHSDVFNAPYGILSVESSHPKRMTFGIARILDASVEIYGPKFILLRTSRHPKRVFKSVDELLEMLREQFLPEEAV
tara:strand:+ start:173 stop:442 length:270 start_codon:yes stop_codon:yes gene_type:complete